MKWSALSRSERRTLLLGALLLGVLLSIRLIGMPYFRIASDFRARLGTERELLLREKMLLARVDAYPRLVETASARLLAVGPRLLAGDTYAAAQTNLARALENAAVKAPARVGQVELLSPQPAGEGLIALPIRVQGESDLEGVLTLLAAFELAEMLLHVQDLEVEAGSRGTAAAPEPSRLPEVLAFRFTLVGFTLAHEAEDAPRGSGTPEASRRERPGPTVGGEGKPITVAQDGE